MTNLADLKLSETINKLRLDILKKQRTLYPSAIYDKYFENFDPKTLPFQHYQDEANQIQQVKDLHNGLYCIEQLLVQLENLGKMTVNPLSEKNFGYLAKQAFVYLNKVSVGVLEDFQEELSEISDYFEHAKDKGKKLFREGEQHRKLGEYLFNLGKGTGFLIKKMGPESGSVGLGGLTETLLRLPGNLEEIRLGLEEYSPTVAKGMPNANYNKLEQLTENLTALKGLFDPSNGKLNYFVNIFIRGPWLARQISKAINDLKEEIGELDASVQNVVLGNLAKLKYDILPYFFGSIDKVELQAMGEPLSFSKVVMDQVRWIYDLIIGATQGIIDYDEKAPQLLSLEDNDFIRCRLKITEESLRNIRLKKHKAEQALQSVTHAIKTIDDVGGWLFGGSQDDEKELNDIVRRIEQRLDGVDKKLKGTLLTGESSWGGYATDWLTWSRQNPNFSNRRQAFEVLKTKLNQIIQNEEFKIKQREALVKEIYQKAHINLSVTEACDDPLQIDPIEVLLRRHGNVDESVLRDEQLERLPSSQRWDLCQELGERRADVESAIGSIDEIINAFDGKVDETFGFGTGPYRALVDKETPPFDENVFVIEFTDGKKLLYRMDSEEPEDGYNLYLATQEKAIEEGLKECYLYDIATKELHWIDKNGVFKKENEEDYQVQRIEEKRVGDDTQIAHARNAVFFKIENGALFYNVRSSSLEGCYLHKKSLDDVLKEKQKNCYVLDEENLIYITPDGRCEAVKSPFEIKDEYLKEREIGEDLYYLNENEIKTVITEPTKPQSHTPVSVHQGSIPLAQLGCSLSSLKKIELLEPYYPKIFSELYKRHQLEDNDRRTVINHFSRLIPYLRSKTFYEDDENYDFLESLIDGINSKQSAANPLTYQQIRQKLASLKEQLKMGNDLFNEEITKLRSGLSYQLIDHQFKSVSLLNYRGISRHLLPFFHDSLPLEVKIEESKKALYKIDILLLDNLRQDMGLTQEELKELSQLKVHHQYLIRHHKKLLKKQNNCEKDKPYRTKDSTIKQAVLFNFPRLKTQLMDKNELGDELLQLKIDKNVLCYRYRYHGRLKTGEIPLSLIKPPIRRFDKQTIVPAKTYESIVDNLSLKMAREIEEGSDELSANEAVDLCFWFQKKHSEFLKIKAQFIEFIDDVRSFQSLSIAEKKTYLVQNEPSLKKKFKIIKPFLHSLLGQERTSNRFILAIKSLDCDDCLLKMREHQQWLEEQHQQYDNKAKSLLREEGVDNLIKRKEKVSPTARDHYLLKSEVISESIASLERSLEKQKRHFDESVKRELNQAQLTGVPYPELDDEKTSLEQAKQALIFKRLSNLLYYFKDAAKALEAMHGKQWSHTYGKHLKQAYFSAMSGYALYNDLVSDPYVSVFYTQLMEQYNSLYTTVINELKLYAPKLSKNDYHSKTAYLTTALNAIYDLPERIKKKSEEEKTASEKNRVELRKRSSKTSRQIDGAISRAGMVLTAKSYIDKAFDWVMIDSDETIPSVFNTSLWIIDQLISIVPLLTYTSAEYLYMSSTLKEVKEKLKRVMHASNERFLIELEDLRENYLDKIVFMADEQEVKYGLKRGIIATPVKEAVDQLYLGLLTQLRTPERIVPELLNNLSFDRKRLQSLKDKSNHCSVEVCDTLKVISAMEETSSLLARVISYVEGAKNRLTFTLGQSQSLTSFLANFKGLYPFIEQALVDNDKSHTFPYVSHRLSGVRVLNINEEQAKEKNITDCLLDFQEYGRRKLVYVGKSPFERVSFSKFNTVALDNAVSQNREKPTRENVDPLREHIHLSGENLENILESSQDNESVLSLGLNGKQLKALREFAKKSKKNAARVTPQSLPSFLSSLMEKGTAHYKGRVNSLRLEQASYRESREAIKQQLRSQERSKKLTQQVYEDFYYERSVSISTTVDNKAVLSVGYHTALQNEFLEAKDEFFNLAHTQELISNHRSANLDQNALKREENRARLTSGWINLKLKVRKIKFDREHLAHFEKLAAFNRSVEKFRYYLNRAERQLARGRSSFESLETLNAKKKIIVQLEQYIKEDCPPGERLENIKQYFDENVRTLQPTLLAHREPNKTLFYHLKQLVLELFYYFRGGRSYERRASDLHDSAIENVYNLTIVKRSWSDFFSSSKMRPYVKAEEEGVELQELSDHSDASSEPSHSPSNVSF